MYKEKIDAWLDSKKEEMLADLTALVAIDSTRGEAKEGMPYGEGPAAALAAMSDLMSRAGMKVRNYENYMIAGDFGEGEKELDILAHLDVVPVTEDWTVTKPFEAKVVGDRIYGRGTSDDKGPAIAALYAIRAIRELGIPLKRSVRLLCGSDEECGSSDLDYYYNIEKEAPCTFTPDADFPLINLEKARLAKSFEASYEADVNPGTPRILCAAAGDKVNVVPGKALLTISGISQETVEAACEKAARNTGAFFTVKPAETESGSEPAVEILVKGTAAHASTPEKGNNAATAMMVLIGILCDVTDLKNDPAAQLLGGLLKVFPHGDTTGEAAGIRMADELSGALTQNLGVLRVENGNICGEFDMRAPLCANDENLTQVIDGCLARAGFTSEDRKMKKAHYVPADSDFVRKLLDSYERYTGQKGEARAIGGGTYVHELERGVAFGCAFDEVDNHMHGDDEFMEIPVLLMSAKIFADAILKICG